MGKNSKLYHKNQGSKKRTSEVKFHCKLEAVKITEGGAPAAIEETIEAGVVMRVKKAVIVAIATIVEAAKILVAVFKKIVLNATDTRAVIRYRDNRSRKLT